MIRLEVTETELDLLHRLLDADRMRTRELVIKDSGLSHLLTRTDGLAERINAAKLRRPSVERGRS